MNILSFTSSAKEIHPENNKDLNTLGTNYGYFSLFQCSVFVNFKGVITSKEIRKHCFEKSMLYFRNAIMKHLQWFGLVFYLLFILIFVGFLIIIIIIIILFYYFFEHKQFVLKSPGVLGTDFPSLP